MQNLTKTFLLILVFINSFDGNTQIELQDKTYFTYYFNAIKNLHYDKDTKTISTPLDLENNLVKGYLQQFEIEEYNKVITNEPLFDLLINKTKKKLYADCENLDFWSKYSYSYRSTLGYFSFDEDYFGVNKTDNSINYPRFFLYDMTNEKISPEKLEILKSSNSSSFGGLGKFDLITNSDNSKGIESSYWGEIEKIYANPDRAQEIKKLINDENDIYIKIIFNVNDGNVYLNDNFNLIPITIDKVQIWGDETMSTILLSEFSSNSVEDRIDEGQAFSDLVERINNDIADVKDYENLGMVTQKYVELTTDNFNKLKYYVENTPTLNENSIDNTIFNVINHIENQKNLYRDSLNNTIKTKIHLIINNDSINQNLIALKNFSNKYVNENQYDKSLYNFVKTNQQFGNLFQFTDAKITGIHDLTLGNGVSLIDYLEKIYNIFVTEKNSINNEINKEIVYYSTQLNNELDGLFLSCNNLNQLILELNKTKLEVIEFDHNVLIDKYNLEFETTKNEISSILENILEIDSNKTKISNDLSICLNEIELDEIKFDFEKSSYSKNTKTLLGIFEYQNSLVDLTDKYSHNYLIDKEINDFINNSKLPFVSIENSILNFKTFDNKLIPFKISSKLYLSIFNENVRIVSQFNKLDLENNSIVETHKILVQQNYDITKANLELINLESNLLNSQEIFYKTFFIEGKSKPTRKRIYSAGLMVLNFQKQKYNNTIEITERKIILQLITACYDSLIVLGRNEEKSNKEIEKKLKYLIKTNNIPEIQNLILQSVNEK